MNKIKNLYIKYKEIVNYILFGALTTIVSLGSYYVCVLTFLDPKNALQLQIANVISWVCAVIFAYVTNRKFVFESKNVNKVREFFKFVGARVATLCIDMLVMAILVSILKWNDKISKIFVQFIVLIMNYIFSKFIVFKKVNKHSRGNAI